MVRARTVISRRGLVIVFRFSIGTPQRFICIALHVLTIDDKRGKFNFSRPNWYDHDDVHLIYDEARARWVDYQISFQNWKTAGFAPREVECNRAVSPASCTQTLKYCDNAGCESRRVVTMRTSNDGYSWSADAGCPGRRETKPGDVNACPTGYNTSGMIVPSPEQDPPELEYYLIAPFRVPSTNRLAAHVLLYAPSPQQILGQRYGLTGGGGKGPSCVKELKGITYNMTHCHGPHMSQERWVSASQDPSDLSAWRRPFRRQRIAPPELLDRTLTAGPFSFRGYTTWAVPRQEGDLSGRGIELWGAPELRLAGMYAPAK